MPNERCHCARLEFGQLTLPDAQPVRAYLGLGSNLGNRRDNLAAAVAALDAAGRTVVVEHSAIYETEPWGYREQPAFLNCAISIDTVLPPAELLALCKEIEQWLGRRPGLRFGPRVVDLDILLYGNQTVKLETPDLTIPHPRLHQRAFALLPLAEIAGNVLHPVLVRTIGELAAVVDGREGVIIQAGSGEPVPPPVDNPPGLSQYL